jgi:hypothetical protein
MVLADRARGYQQIGKLTKASPHAELGLQTNVTNGSDSYWQAYVEPLSGRLRSASVNAEGLNYGD